MLEAFKLENETTTINNRNENKNLYEYTGLEES